jgi:hypothetical protein
LVVYACLCDKILEEAPHLLNLQGVIDGATLNNLIAMIVCSFVEYEGLNEQDVVNKLVFFWS